MTDLAKLKQATDLMAKTSISVDEFLQRVKTQPGYRYLTTPMYKSFKALELAAKTTPNKPPFPTSTNLGDVQRCLFLTGDTRRALETRDRLLIATADLGYRNFYSRDFIEAAVKQDRFRVWCDCHSTMPPVAYKWLEDLGLPRSYFYGECESSAAFDTAYIAGSRKMVGNLSVLTDSQLARVASGEVHVTNETYFNVNPNYGVDWRNANAGVGSNCVAVYPSVTEGARYYSLEDQAKDSKYNPARDCIYVAGFEDPDWEYTVAH